MIVLDSQKFYQKHLEYQLEIVEAYWMMIENTEQ